MNISDLKMSKFMSKLFHKDMLGLFAFLIGVILVVGFVLFQVLPVAGDGAQIVLVLAGAFAALVVLGGFIWVVRHCIATYYETYSHDAVWVKAIGDQKKAKEA